MTLADPSPPKVIIITFFWSLLLGNYGNGCNEWIQTSNPATDSTITGFIPINLSFVKDSYFNDWAGIGKHNNEIAELADYEIALINDAPNRINGFTPIGSYLTYPSNSTLMVGPIGPSVEEMLLYGNTVVELYVKSKNENWIKYFLYFLN